VNQNINSIKSILLALSVLFCTEVLAASPSDKTNTSKEVSVFATIGKEKITWQDYQIAFSKEAKNKLYHGQPSNEVMAAFQRTVADKLITDALLLNEANRRKLKPDTNAVNQEVEKFEQKLANDEEWKKSRDRVLPNITKRFQNENLIKKLESIVRQIPAPSEAQIRTYYTIHPDKFTAPAEQRVSLILLGVDPSSTSEEWKKTIEDGKVLVKRIRDGEDFAEMAKQYSRDEQTVDQGGDMGYLHDGMLPGMPQETVNKLKVGEISEPIRLLEGVAIFRLTDRKQPGLSNFDSAKQRATELLLSEQSDSAWNSLIVNLKKRTPMRIDESRFLPLTNASLPASTTK
jgi:peptidyl-prolyl cis-trans isomerase C